MALTQRSLFLYGFAITQLNNAIDFKTSALGSTLQATLQIGFYSLSSLADEIVRAMAAADPNASNIYTVTVDRTIMGGTQNRVTITTSGVYLDLLFNSGPRAAASVAYLIGFPNADQTGAITYTGTATAGTAFQPTYIGYNYLGPDFMHKVFGSVNVSSIGEKEAIVFNIQRFIQVQFRYETSAKFINDWLPFMDWAIQQKQFDYTPEITSPDIFYAVTLESSSDDSKGLGFRFNEMLPQFPGLYDSGLMRFRVRIVSTNVLA